MTKKEVLILGIGNLLWADEGFGVRCVEHIDDNYKFDDSVEVVDGGTQGLYLLPFIENAKRLIVFDAVDYGKKPGEFVVAENDEVPRFMGAKKISLHQTGFQEVIFAAQFKDVLPQNMVLIGVQAQELEDYGGSLRPLIKSKIPSAVAIALKYLEQWNIKYQVQNSQTPIANSARVNSEVLKLDVYEQERPSADSACRVGDNRFLGK